MLLFLLIVIIILLKILYQIFSFIRKIIVYRKKKFLKKEIIEIVHYTIYGINYIII